MGKFSVQAGVKKEKHKNSNKKREDIRGNAGGLGPTYDHGKFLGNEGVPGSLCPLHPSSCPKQPVLHSIANIIVICHHKKSWQTIFVGLSSNAIYETFFCNELDQTVCFSTLLGPGGYPG